MTSSGVVIAPVIAPTEKKHFDQKEEIKTPQRERAARWSGSDMRL
jgi:hypothetical protein